MAYEVSKIIAGNSTDKNEIVLGNDTVVLSSPYFDEDESRFTDLSTVNGNHSDISLSDQSTDRITIIQEEGKIKSISFLGEEIPILEILDFYVDTEVVCITKNDGTVIRLPCSDVSGVTIEKIIKSIESGIEKDSSIQFFKSTWRRIE